MFSSKAIADTEEKFSCLLEHVGGEKKGELLAHLRGIRETESETVLFAVKWLYANSPLSDWANYAFSMFHACAAHGIFLRSQSDYAKDLPEELFLNYVLHSRVNEEALCDCRGFFYDLLHERVQGMSCREATIEINYWNAENLTYQSTDPRTISALGAYHSCYGRCGEESAFAVNVLRALGIAARQIYTPRWAHCDDNHAWVEVWVEDDWHFLGACEPEEVLDQAWFTNAASRALLIHSRSFGDISSEECISKKGMAFFLNNLSRYAETRSIQVRVCNAQGAPLPGVEVSFGILNYSEIFPAAEVTTDQRGEARLTCGLGSLFVRARKDGISCERLIHVPEVNSVEMTLQDEAAAYGVWTDLVVKAPKDAALKSRLTEAQKVQGMQKLASANEKRANRVRRMFDAERAERVVARHGYSQSMVALLEDSRGNYERLMEFLEEEAYDAREKEALLHTLSDKDKRDVDPDILREALDLAPKDGWTDASLFFSFVVCPRIYQEPLSKYRGFILGFFSDAEKARFRAEPESIWRYILKNIGCDVAVEYGQIVTTPVGALTVKNASPLSRKILFVAICRTLGIAARLNAMDRQLEFYQNGRFVVLEQEEERNCTLRFTKEAHESWRYGPDFSFARRIDGAYQTYALTDEAWDGNAWTVAVEPGDYRIITDNRLPNGDIHARMYHLRLEGNQERSVQLRKSPAALQDMLASYVLEDFKLFDAEGNPVWGSTLTQGRTVLMWLEEGVEPTEHILNEMLESAQDFETLPADMIFILRGKEALENEKLRCVLERFPAIRVFYDSFVPNVETLARRLFVDPEKLPLIVVTNARLHAVYASSGYNVGSGRMIVRICRSLL